MTDDIVGHAQIPNWLLRDPSVNHNVKMLYAYLSSRTGREGVCWPSQDLIAHEVGLSVATIQRALAIMREMGLVTVTVEKTPTGRRNRYLLHNSIQGGSPHSEGMGDLTVRSEEEPVEEEPNPSTLSSRPQVVDAGERRGRMTDSWNPTPVMFGSAKDAYPKVNVKREVVTFKAWHQSKAAVERTQAEWDNLFVTWCGRKQEQWEAANPPAEQDPWDPVTGMPRHPKQAGTPPVEE